jgi:predicted CXXCH cytochrome family protein
MVWPGPHPPGRSSADADKCLNCHDPHGAKDKGGLIPAMTSVREEGLCLGCHNGSPATDIRSEFRKPFVHPVWLSGRHEEAEGGSSAAFAAPSRRHAECEDCHNPHMVMADPFPPHAPDASNRLAGVGRIKVTNGAAGARPIYTWAGPDDRAFPMEFELCFKCHSSWTTRPAGQSDLALLLNPANPSFHPVERSGQNPGILQGAFANGWSADRLTYCSDCHGSDDGSAGPHGSNFRHLLKQQYPDVSRASMAPTDLCFTCHAWNTYGNPAGATLAASRFNPPAIAQGHAFHVSQGYSCFACHETHGSIRMPALISTARSPGIVGYSQTPMGATCTTTCHGASTYSLNYGRSR